MHAAGIRTGAWLTRVFCSEGAMSFFQCGSRTLHATTWGLHRESGFPCACLQPIKYRVVSGSISGIQISAKPSVWINESWFAVASPKGMCREVINYNIHHTFFIYFGLPPFQKLYITLFSLLICFLTIFIPKFLFCMSSFLHESYFLFTFLSQVYSLLFNSFTYLPHFFYSYLGNISACLFFLNTTALIKDGRRLNDSSFLLPSPLLSVLFSHFLSPPIYFRSVSSSPGSSAVSHVFSSLPPSAFSLLALFDSPSHLRSALCPLSSRLRCTYLHYWCLFMENYVMRSCTAISLSCT